jgi:hypothetical protein
MGYWVVENGCFLRERRRRITDPKPNTFQLSTRFAQKLRSAVKHEPHNRKARKKAYKMRF